VKLDFVILPEEGRSCKERLAMAVGVYERMDVGVSEGVEWFDGNAVLGEGGDNAGRQGEGGDFWALAVVKLSPSSLSSTPLVSSTSPSAELDPSAEPVPTDPDNAPNLGGSTKAELELVAEATSTNGSPGE
jgi:hypothetical protein